MEQFFLSRFEGCPVMMFEEPVVPAESETPRRPIDAQSLLRAEELGAQIIRGEVSSREMKQAIFSRRAEDTAGCDLPSEALWPLAVAAGAGREFPTRAALGRDALVQSVKAFFLMQMTLSDAGTWSAAFAAWSIARGDASWSEFKNAKEIRLFADAPIEEAAMPEIMAVRAAEPLPLALSFKKRRVDAFSGIETLAASTIQSAIGALPPTSALAGVVAAHASFLGHPVAFASAQAAADAPASAISAEKIASLVQDRQSRANGADGAPAGDKPAV
jgi:hypothetical protein